MTNHTLKSGLRNLWKNRTLGFINIGGLAIGMSAAFLVLLWVQNEFSYDGFQPDADRDYLVTWDYNGRVSTDFSPLPLTSAALQRIPAVEDATCYYLFPGADLPEIHIGGQTRTEKKVMFTDSSWFRLFRYDFVAGNANDFGTIKGVILTASLATSYFGTTAAVGRDLRIDSDNYVVRGVVSDNPVNSSFQYRLFLPLKARFASPADRTAAYQAWKTNTAKTFIRLRSGVAAGGCERQFDELIKANGGLAEQTAKLVPLKEMHFGVGLSSSDMAYGDRKVATIFGCLGALILLIACINYLNMATARASLRVKEISMKKIMGASRGRLWRQLMMEALLTATIALLFTLLLIWITLPAFGRLFERNFVFSFSSPAVLDVLLGTWVLSVAITGIYPAFLLSAFDPLATLQADKTPNTTSAWVRKALVVVQFTAAVALILGSIIIYSQLSYIQQQSQGYDKSQVFTIQLPRSSWYKRNAPGRRGSIMQALKTELQRQPAIQNVGYVSGPLMQMPMSMSGVADWDGKDKNFNPVVYPMYIDPEARSLFGIELVAGKWFLPGDTSDRHNYVLNETAAATFGLHQPYVGQRFMLADDTGLVIGIIKDFHFRSLHEKIAPVVMLNNPGWKNILYVRASPHAVPGAIRVAGEMFGRFFPDQTFNYTFLDEDFERLYKSDIKTSKVIGGFAGIAMLLSCLGLLGLAAFTAKQREKEIATRKVLGATVRHIVTQLSGSFLKLVIVSLLIACPVGWWAMYKWLEDFAYRTPISWWMFAVAGGLAIGIAFLTVALQAIKAAIANPINSLRNL
jgi:putative ABC transport system permease protein